MSPHDDTIKAPTDEDLVQAYGNALWDIGFLSTQGNPAQQAAAREVSLKASKALLYRLLELRHTITFLRLKEDPPP